MVGHVRLCAFDRVWHELNSKATRINVDYAVLTLGRYVPPRYPETCVSTRGHRARARCLSQAVFPLRWADTGCQTGASVIRGRGVSVQYVSTCGQLVPVRHRTTFEGLFLMNAYMPEAVTPDKHCWIYPPARLYDTSMHLQGSTFRHTKPPSRTFRERVRDNW